MNIAIFEQYIGKNVCVRTIDALVSGTLETLEEDFIKVTKYNKNGSVKFTMFLACNAITSITIK